MLSCILNTLVVYIINLQVISTTMSERTVVTKFISARVQCENLDVLE